MLSSSAAAFTPAHGHEQTPELGVLPVSALPPPGLSLQFRSATTVCIVAAGPAIKILMVEIQGPVLSVVCYPKMPALPVLRRWTPRGSCKTSDPFFRLGLERDVALATTLIGRGFERFSWNMTLVERFETEICKTGSADKCASHAPGATDLRLRG